MIRQPISTRYSVTLMALSLVCVFGGYTYLSYAQHLVNPTDTTMPSWAQLADGVRTIVTPNARTGERWLLVDSGATFGRLFLGMAIGVLGSFIVGVFMGCDARAEAFFRLPISGFGQIPAVAAMAVFFVIAGLGLKMYVAMIVFGILPSLTLAVYLSVKDVPEELVYKAYTLGASNMEVVWDVIVKIITPKFIDVVKIAMGAAVVALIAAEYQVGDVGFGYRIRLQGRLQNMNVVYPYLTVLMGFGYVMAYLFKVLQRRACEWFVTSNGRSS